MRPCPKIFQSAPFPPWALIWSDWHLFQSIFILFVVLSKIICVDLGLGYTDTFSDYCVFNRSTKVWISYSNICVFMIVFILSVWTASENVAIFFLFQIRIQMIFLKMCKQKRHWKASPEVMVALSNERQFSKLV